MPSSGLINKLAWLHSVEPCSLYSNPT